MEVQPFRHAAQDALAATGLFSARSLAEAGIEPVEGGLTNHSFHIAVGEGRYVLRMPGAGTDAYIDRAQEAHNARAAARLGIAPDLVYSDPRSGVALTRRIDGGRVLDEHAFSDPATLERAVGLLARLHRSDADFRGEVSLFESLGRYYRLCERRPDLLEPLEGARRRAQRLQSWIESAREPHRPCHIDPAPSNFMLGEGAPPRLYLLDWEFSARCEPIWDLAYLSADAALSEAQEAHLLSCYHGRAGAEDEDRFLAYKGILELLIAAWAALRIADGDEDPAVRGLLTERAAMAEQILESLTGGARSRVRSRSP